MTCPKSHSLLQVAELGLKPGPRRQATPRGLRAQAASEARASGKRPPNVGLLAADFAYITHPFSVDFSFLSIGLLSDNRLEVLRRRHALETG